MMKKFYDEDIELLINELNNNKIIAIPTETVYGLAVNCSTKENYGKLVEAKNRDASKPFTLMVSKVTDIKKYALVDNKTERVINKFMPGSLTIILPKNPAVPGYFDNNSNFIGFRIPDNETLLTILNKLEYPLFMPSANPKGLTPAKNLIEVENYFENKIDGVFISNKIKQDNTPSTVIKIENDNIILLREGKISLEEIKEEYHD